MRFLAAILLLLLVLPAQAQQGQGMSQALVVSSCGAAALPTSGPLVQLLMNPQGQLCMTGVASLGPPVNSVAPVASGTASVGSTLSCTTGTWTLSPSSYAYTWLRGGSTISGATSATYVLVSADWGTSVGCSVIATNGSGNSSPAASNTIAITGCPQAVTYLARTTGGNEGGNANITPLICGLVKDGVWAKLDALYVLAQQNSTDALLNLVGTSYTLSIGGGGTFTAYIGLSSFAGGGVSTGFNPVSGVNYTQNSASVGIWAYTVTATAGVDYGDTTANNSFIIPKYSGGGNLFFARINDGSTTGVTQPGTKGLFSGDRSSSTQNTPYWNGVSQGTQSTSSVVVTTASVTIGSGNAFGATTDTISAAYIGGSLGSAGQLALYNRLRTYMTAVGVP